MSVQRTVILPIEFHPALAHTLDEAAGAYRILSELAFASQTYARFALHKLAYHEVRAATMLTAQMTASAIRKVSGAYKSMKANNHLPDEPARFEKRCLELEGGSRGRDFRIYPDKGIVSISTVEGRKKLSYRCGDFQRAYLESPKWTIQAAKLIHKRRRKGWRYELHVSVVCDEPKSSRVDGILGVDTGRRYLAVASTGHDAAFFSAGHLKPKKEHFRRIRGKLSSKGTRSSTRTFVRVAGREARPTRQFQHETVNALVRLALECGCDAIAVERLNGIRERTTARGPKARYHATWAYAQFRDILCYKAEGAGLEVIEVDPANTSRACNECGCVHKASRKGMSFSCRQCGYSLHADLCAARNIRLRAIQQRQDVLLDGPKSCGPEADSGFPENGKLSGLTDST